jgi:hypothetical protein
MESCEIELHALACEIADVDGLNYDEALARACQQFGAVQEYAHEWDECAAYLEVLATLCQGKQPTVAQLDALVTGDWVVTYLLQQVR